MKVVQINGGVFGSTGKIMFGISNLAEKNNIETKCFSPVTSTNHNRETNFPYEKCGTYRGRQISVFIDRITGYNGCSAVITTKKLLKKITSFNPDVIHLHNLHNSYINLPMLFNYIKKHNIHTVWTLHDCWAFTGQCPHFTMVKCDKWKTGCHHCPQYRQYPQSYVDRTKTMWRLKKKWFTGVQNMVIVTPSQWLANLVKESFLKDYSVKVIRNGIDLDVFKPTANSFRQAYGLQNKKIILSVAFGWGERKGYGDCLKLAGILDDDYHMVLVGVSKEQISALPKNVLGIERTNSQKELVEIYSASDVFINTTYEDNYPTVNLEARACGLPIITYKTGGSPESAGTDAVSVETGDILSLKEAVETTIEARKQQKVKNEDISSDAKFKEYIELYRSANAGGGGGTPLEKNTIV